MSTRADLAWLAGIIDGEGTVALSHGGNRAPHLRLMIYNGAPGIIEKVTAILGDNGIPFYGKWDRREKPCFSFLIGTRGCLDLYPLIRPHLVRQIEQLDAGYAFMSAAYKPGAQRVRWTDEQRAAWEVLRRRFHNVAAA